MKMGKDMNNTDVTVNSNVIKAIKQEPSVKLDNNKLTIKGLLGEADFNVMALWIVNRGAKSIFKIEENKPSSKFRFEVDFAGENGFFKTAFYDFYILIEVPNNKLSPEDIYDIKSHTKLTSIKENEGKIEFPLRLTQFAQTKSEDLGKFKMRDKQYIIYVTTHGSLSLAINKQLKSRTVVQTEYLETKGHDLTLAGKVFTENSRLVSAELCLTGRESNARIKCPISSEFSQAETENNYGLKVYKYHGMINLNTMSKDELLKVDTYDLFLECHFHDKDDVTLIRIRKAQSGGLFDLKDSYAKQGNSVFNMTPYFTYKLSNLSIKVNQFDIKNLII